MLPLLKVTPNAIASRQAASVLAAYATAHGFKAYNYGAAVLVVIPFWYIAGPLKGKAGAHLATVYSYTELRAVLGY